MTARPADVDVCDDAGVRHRLWAVPADGDGGPTVGRTGRAGRRADPSRSSSAAPTYDSAVRYRDERRMSRSCEEDPAFDYVLALLIERSDASRLPNGRDRPRPQSARVVTE